MQTDLRSVYLVRLKSGKDVLRLPVEQEDPLLKGKLLPVSTAESASPGAARFVGDYATLMSEESWWTIQANAPTAYFLGARHIAVLTAQAGAEIKRLELHRPAGREPFDGSAWQPVVALLERENHKEPLDSRDVLFVDHEKPSQLIFLKNRDAEWGVTTFAKVAREPARKVTFTRADSSSMPPALQDLGAAVMQWFQYAEAGSLRRLSCAGMAQNQEPNTLPVNLGSCTGGHWAMWLEVRLQDGQRLCRWRTITGTPGAQLTSDKLSIQSAKLGGEQLADSAALQELVQNFLRTLESNGPKAAPLGELTRALAESGKDQWDVIAAAKGEQVEERYRSWQTERAAIIRPLDLKTPPGRQQLIQCLLAPLQEWSLYLKAHPRGLVFGE